MNFFFFLLYLCFQMYNNQLCEEIVVIIAINLIIAAFGLIILAIFKIQNYFKLLINKK